MLALQNTSHQKQKHSNPTVFIVLAVIYNYAVCSSVPRYASGSHCVPQCAAVSHNMHQSHTVSRSVQQCPTICSRVTLCPAVCSSVQQSAAGSHCVLQCAAVSQDSANVHNAVHFARLAWLEGRGKVKINSLWKHCLNFIDMTNIKYTTFKYHRCIFEDDILIIFKTLWEF